MYADLRGEEGMHASRRIIGNGEVYSCMVADAARERR